ncbi:MAG TPA: nitroreductase/quinone reductase family protein [Candidatus Limnocylindria bacterium]|nr:nitroreductase/quinone reductase family protein [Candidatus Limnocylindria bacterium]
MTDSSIGEQLAGWGKVALLETRGRVTRRRATAAIGFFEPADGELLVAAGSLRVDWALNLQADPRCRVTIGERTAAYLAVELDGRDRADAVTALILKYGTPAEGLGHGPVFRLRPADGR